MPLTGKLLTDVEVNLLRVVNLPYHSPFTTATSATVLTALLLFLAFAGVSTSLGRGLLLGTLAFLAINFFSIAWYEQRILMTYKQNLAKELSVSNLIEKLALGWEQLELIFDYTPLPWRSFLGPRPRSLARAVLLLVGNIEWYMREPRTNINPLWIVCAFAFGALMVLIGGVLSAVQSLRVGAGISYSGYIVLGSAVVIQLSTMWCVAHYFLRQKVAAIVLLAELKSRAESD